MSATTLKLIALIAMIIDHIGHYIPETPDYFRWIGRIAAPIFIYFIAIGSKHTSNHKKYLLHLYIAGVIMAFLSLFINSRYSDYNHEITANFFATLFSAGCIIFLINQKKITYWIYYALWQVVSAFLCFLFSEVIIIHDDAFYHFYGPIFGSVIFNEGSIFMVLLGVLFYLAQAKYQLIVGYIGYVFILTLTILKYGTHLGPYSYHMLPFSNYQWLMVAALPLILLYNGQRGRGFKYFFYIFYPLHIILLYFIGFKFV